MLHLVALREDGRFWRGFVLEWEYETDKVSKREDWTGDSRRDFPEDVCR